MKELVDLAAERAVLAGVFHYGEDVLLDIDHIVQASTFTDESNQYIWKSIKYLFEEKRTKEFDQASIIAAASELGYSVIVNKPEEIKHLASIFRTRVLEQNVITWAAKIRKLEIARLLREQLADADQRLTEISGAEPIEVILGLAEDAVLDFSKILNESESKATERLSEGLGEWLKHVESNPSETVGIPSGWPIYDAAIGGGFRRGTISLVGARPKTGKSMVALNVAINVASLGIPVLILDTEMQIEDHWPRTVASVSKRNNGIATIDDIELGRFGKNAFMKRKIIEAKEQIDNIPLHYRSVIGLTIEETLPLIRKWIHKEVGNDENGNIKDCLIIYDYIKLQSADNLSDTIKEYQALGFTMTTLHNFVGRFGIPMFALIQLNRDGQTQETGSAFSQSDRILWLVTNYSIFKAKSDEEVAEGELDSGNRKMVPISARHGKGMREGNYINMWFNQEFALIKEGKTRDSIMRAKNDARRESEDLGDPTGGSNE